MRFSKDEFSLIFQFLDDHEILLLRSTCSFFFARVASVAMLASELDVTFKRNNRKKLFWEKLIRRTMTFLGDYIDTAFFRLFLKHEPGLASVIAVKKGRDDVVLQIVSSGRYDPAAYGGLALFEAAFSGSITLSCLLLEHGASPVACSNASARRRLILEYDRFAKVSVGDRSAVLLAGIWSRNVELVEKLCQFIFEKDDLEPLRYVVVCWSAEDVKHFFMRNTNLCLCNLKQSPLSLAAYAEVGVVEFLLSYPGCHVGEHPQSCCMHPDNVIDEADLDILGLVLESGLANKQRLANRAIYLAFKEGSLADVRRYAPWVGVCYEEVVYAFVHDLEWAQIPGWSQFKITESFVLQVIEFAENHLLDAIRAVFNDQEICAVLSTLSWNVEAVHLCLNAKQTRK